MTRYPQQYCPLMDKMIHKYECIITDQKASTIGGYRTKDDVICEGEVDDRCPWTNQTWIDPREYERLREMIPDDAVISINPDLKKHPEKYPWLDKGGKLKKIHRGEPIKVAAGHSIKCDVKRCLNPARFWISYLELYFCENHVKPIMTEYIECISEIAADALVEDAD